MLHITPIPAFQDNYFWLIEKGEETWVVDPGDAKPVLDALDARGKKLTGILITHHHPDHVGGVAQLSSPDLQIIGPKKDRFRLVNDPVTDGDTRMVCNVEFQIMEVPGHTLNHVAYFADPENQPPLLFCGDTLFSAGCGRLFEGTPKQMYESLGRLQKLPDDTLIYCAHEYTEANLRFAKSVEPGNSYIARHMKDVAALRAAGTPSVPTSLKKEKTINPFLRTMSEEIIATAMSNTKTMAKPDEVEIFATIRKMKDQF